MSADTPTPQFPFDAATDEAIAQVKSAQDIIGKEVTQLGSILDQLSRPVIDNVLEQIKMPDF